MIRELIPRVLRDIDNGVFALDLNGRIIYTNPQIEAMLGLRPEDLGQSYAKTFLFDNPKGKENDEFHQFIIDAVYDKKKTHDGTVAYFDHNGNKRFLHVTSSFLNGENDREQVGIVLVVSDVTEKEILKKKHKDACLMFSCVVACISSYLLLLGSFRYFGIEVSSDVLTQVINGMVFIFAIIIFKKTEFSKEELGLKLVKPVYTILSSLAISAGIIAVMILAKLVMLQVMPEFFPAGAPFWKWDFGVYFWLGYLFTCVIQEFLARSVIYGSIRKMFEGSNPHVSIALAAMLFGAVHIGHNFVLMVGAIVLLGSLSGLYEKHGNIWGVTIIHYVIGQVVYCLGFIV